MISPAITFLVTLALVVTLLGFIYMMKKWEDKKSSVEAEIVLNSLDDESEIHI